MKSPSQNSFHRIYNTLLYNDNIIHNPLAIVYILLFQFSFLLEIYSL